MRDILTGWVKFTEALAMTDDGYENKDDSSCMHLISTSERKKSFPGDGLLPYVNVFHLLFSFPLALCKHLISKESKRQEGLSLMLAFMAMLTFCSFLVI